jgi:hypothetical protein
MNKVERVHIDDRHGILQCTDPESSTLTTGSADWPRWSICNIASVARPCHRQQWVIAVRCGFLCPQTPRFGPSVCRDSVRHVDIPK